jgi:hypothetical protein
LFAAGRALVLEQGRLPNDRDGTTFELEGLAVRDGLVERDAVRAVENVDA